MQFGENFKNYLLYSAAISIHSLHPFHENNNLRLSYLMYISMQGKFYFRTTRFSISKAPILTFFMERQYHTPPGLLQDQKLPPSLDITLYSEVKKKTVRYNLHLNFSWSLMTKAYDILLSRSRISNIRRSQLSEMEAEVSLIR